MLSLHIESTDSMIEKIYSKPVHVGLAHACSNYAMHYTYLYLCCDQIILKEEGVR